MSNNLRLWAYDQNWAGSIIVAATTKEQATQYIQSSEFYRGGDLSKIKELEIKEGIIFENAGDQ